MGALLKYRFVFLLLAAFGLAGADVFAQTGHFIRGEVRDSATGEALQGVSVRVVGTQTRFWYGDMEKIPTNGEGVENLPHGWRGVSVFWLSLQKHTSINK